MKYYAKYENGNLLYVGTDCGGEEIAEAEYNEIISMIREKASLTDRLYCGEITISDVPPEWREEIQKRVDALIEEYGTIDEQEISDAEAMSILFGGEIE